MVACCAHHVTDFFPILGLGVATMFLNKYQFVFILFGLISNFVGIIFMLSTIQKHRLFSEKSILSKIMNTNMDKAFKASIILGALLLIVTIITTF